MNDISMPPPGSVPGPSGADGAGETGDDPLVPLGLREWFGLAGGVVRRSLGALTALSTLSALVGVVASIAMDRLVPLSLDPSGPPVEPAPEAYGGLLAVLLATLALAALLQAASLFVAIRDAGHRPATPAEVFRFAARRALPLFGWWLLAILLIWVGSILLVAPGVYLGVVIGGSLTCVVVVERRGLGRCFGLIKRRFWATFGRLLLFALAGGAYYGLVVLAAMAVGGDLTSVTTTVVSSALMIPLGVVSTAVALVTYAELRRHEDAGVTTARLAAQLAG